MRKEGKESPAYESHMDIYVPLRTFERIVFKKQKGDFIDQIIIRHDLEMIIYEIMACEGIFPEEIPGIEMKLHPDPDLPNKTFDWDWDGSDYDYEDYEP